MSYTAPEHQPDTTPEPDPSQTTRRLHLVPEPVADPEPVDAADPTAVAEQRIALAATSLVAFAFTVLFAYCTVGYDFQTDALLTSSLVLVAFTFLTTASGCVTWVCARNAITGRVDA